MGILQTSCRILILYERDNLYLRFQQPDIVTATFAERIARDLYLLDGIERGDDYLSIKGFVGTQMDNFLKLLRRTLVQFKGHKPLTINKMSVIKYNTDVKALLFV